MRISDWSSDVCSSDLALATAQWLQGEAYVRLNEIDRARPLIDHAWSTVSKRAPSSKLAGDIMLSRGGVHSAIPDVAAALADYTDRQNVVSGKGVEDRVDSGGRRIIKKKKKIIHLT